MLISIDQWRASIGIFYDHAYALICKLTKLKLDNIEFFISYFLPIILFLLLLLHGDLESNHCHRNVNSLVAHKKYLC